MSKIVEFARAGQGVYGYSSSGCLFVEISYNQQIKGVHFIPEIPFCFPFGAELYMVEQVSLSSKEGRILWYESLSRAWVWAVEVTGTAPVA